MKKILFLSVLFLFMSCNYSREFNPSPSSSRRFVSLMEECDNGIFYRVVLDRTTGNKYLIAGYPGSGYGVTRL